jgi:hypothetical protein
VEMRAHASVPPPDACLTSNALQRRFVAMPDRLPSLVLLVGCWVAPAVAGWVAAGIAHRSTPRVRAVLKYAVLTS